MPKYSNAVMQLSEFLKANAAMPPVTGWPRAEAEQPKRATA